MTDSNEVKGNAAKLAGPAAAAALKAANEARPAKAEGYTMSPKLLAELEAGAEHDTAKPVAKVAANKPVAQPAVHKPVATVTAQPAIATASIDFSGGEVTTGIAEVNYAINGDVFGQLAAFNAQVAKGQLTARQHSAFLKGGEAVMDRLDTDVSGEFGNYLSKLAAAVQDKAPKEYLGEKNNPLYAAIAAQMDKYRTGNMPPQEIAAKMFEPSVLAETARLAAVIDKPTIVKEPQPVIATRTDDPIGDIIKKLELEEKSRQVGKPAKAALSADTDPKIHRAQAPQPIDMVRATQGVQSVIVPDGKGSDPAARLVAALRNNGDLRALIGTRLDFDGDGKAEPKEIAALANEIFGKSVTKSAAQIADMLKDDKLIASAREEYGDSIKHTGSTPKVAIRIVPDAVDSGKGQGR